MLRFEKIDFELCDPVEAAVEILAERAQAKGLELASVVYHEVTTSLRGDAGRLRQVLTNLIGNAVKFTDRGEVVVSVRTVSESATHATLRFEIRDTGIGISGEAQRRLFLPFNQADGSTTRKYGGTGLGLAISKQLVELMGGNIGIESTPGLGSTFWFTGKFEKRLGAAIKRVKVGVRNVAGVRVLIVDDNVTNRSILKHQTTSWGMIASEAESGKQALALLRSAHARGEAYDMAILDFLMPEMDGFELAELIKADTDIPPVALVVLSSFGKRGHDETARKTGIAAYLQKPVRQSQLYNCLTTIMAGLVGRPPSHTSRTATSIPRPEQTTKTPRKGAMSKTRILVAEDNVINQRVALGQLRSLGYRGKAVGNGRDVLKAMEKHDFDLILMDCQMPEMDGFEATAAIRRKENGMRHTTIIAMTANALEGDSDKCLASGMDDYLSKPVKTEVLQLKLQKWAKPPIDSATPVPVALSRSKSKLKKPGVLNLDVLAELRKLQQPRRPDFVTELIDLFLTDTSAQLKILRTAVSSKDVTEVHRLAHLMKGSSANIGAGRMAALYDGFESNKPGVRRGLTDDQTLVKLEAEFRQVRRALKTHRMLPGKVIR